MSSFCKRNGERLLGDIWRKEEVFNTFKWNSNFGTIRPTSLPYRHTDTNIWSCFIDIVMKRIYLFNIVAWNYRKKIGFPVCTKENFAGIQAHRKRGKSARASPTPHHTLGTFSTDGFQDGYGNRKWSQTLFRARECHPRFLAAVAAFPSTANRVVWRTGDYGSFRWVFY